MVEELLIKNTTREQRKKIVRDSLSCTGSGCENCSACGVYGAGDPYEMYLPYIEGKKELSEISREFNANYLHG